MCGLNFMRRKMRMRGFTIVEFLVVIATIVILAFMLRPTITTARPEARKIRCAYDLKQLGTAMNMYFAGFGNGVSYTQPAEMFYGDTWLLSLYWEGIVVEPKLFICPNTSDDATKILHLVKDDYAAAIPADAVSYAGRCHGLNTNPWRNTIDFSVDGLSPNSMMACDDAQGKDNHGDGMNAVFFDSHVEFIANGTAATAYSQVGTKGTTWANGELEKMDSGGGK